MTLKVIYRRECLIDLNKYHYWFVAALCFIVDVRTNVRTYSYVRTDIQTDIFTGFIRSSLRRCVMDNAVGCYAYGNMFWCL